MRLFLLQAIEGCEDFQPWYDKAFGHVVRAGNEEEARQFAAGACGNEGREAWLDNEKTSCEPLTANGGDAGVVLTDFKAA